MLDLYLDLQQHYSLSSAPTEITLDTSLGISGWGGSLNDIQELGLFWLFLGHFSHEAMQITIIEKVNQNDEWMQRMSHVTKNKSTELLMR